MKRKPKQKIKKIKKNSLRLMAKLLRSILIRTAMCVRKLQK